MRIAFYVSLFLLTLTHHGHHVEPPVLLSRARAHSIVKEVL